MDSMIRAEQISHYDKTNLSSKYEGHMQSATDMFCS